MKYLRQIPSEIKAALNQWVYKRVIKILCWDCGRESQVGVLEIKCQWEINSWSDSYCNFPPPLKIDPFVQLGTELSLYPLERLNQLSLLSTSTAPTVGLSAALLNPRRVGKGMACLHMKARCRHPNSTWRPEMGWEARVIWFRRQIQPTSTDLLMGKNYASKHMILL
jgi:hypothetical protein